MPAVYGTPAGFRTYHGDRGNTLPSGSNDDDIVLQWLLVGSEALDGRYRSSFPGYKTGQRSQEREWPRIGAADIYGNNIPSDVPPIEVEYATYELAIRVPTISGGLSPDFTPNKYTSVRVEGAVSVDYNIFTSWFDAQKKFPIVDQILAPILTADGFGNTSMLSGRNTRV